MTAQIETKLTKQDDPTVEAENEFFKAAKLSRAGAKEALESARDLEAEELPAIHETTESVRINGGSRAAKFWTVVRVKHLWRGQHSNSYIQIGDEMVLLNAELDGDDSKKQCCIKSFDEIIAEKMIWSD